MKLPGLILLMLVLCNISFAQPDNSKSATRNTYSAVWYRVDRLNSQARNIYLAYPDSAHKLAGNALILAEKSNYVTGKGVSFLNLGIIYWSQSYYPISLFYLKSAMASLPRNNARVISECYRALARTCADLKDYTAASRYIDTSELYARHDTAALAAVYSEQIYLYRLLKKYGPAIDAAKRVVAIDKRNRMTPVNRSVLYGRLASVYLDEKDYATALRYNDTACRISIGGGNRRLRAYAYAEYAEAYNGLKQYDKAIGFSRKAVVLADSMGLIDADTKAYGALIQSYELKNNIAKALRVQKQYIARRDSLASIAKLKTVSLVENYYDLDAKMNNITLMQANDRVNKAKIKSQKALITTLALSLIVLLVMLSATYYFYKQKKFLSDKLQQQHKALSDQKQLIEVQTANLQTVNGLKDKLLAVIGHDLRSPVANLSNIVEMFGAGYLSDAELAGLMKDLSPVVKSVDLTLTNLLEWAGSQIRGKSIESTTVDIFLLGMEMEQTFLHAFQHKDLEFVNQAYPGQGVLADENHIKVILRNLISNAIKFTPEQGVIRLATVISHHELIVRVEDSGKGMTADEIEKLFSLNTHFSHCGTSGEKGTGIGLLLCKELVELNGGKLKVKSTPDKGTVFYFNLPLLKAYA